PTERGKMRLHGSESGAERQGTREARALDLEARFRGDAARELESRLQVAVPAWLEGDHLGHGFPGNVCKFTRATIIFIDFNAGYVPSSNDDRYAPAAGPRR